MRISCLILLDLGAIQKMEIQKEADFFTKPLAEKSESTIREQRQSYGCEKINRLLKSVSLLRLPIGRIGYPEKTISLSLSLWIIIRFYH